MVELRNDSGRWDDSVFDRSRDSSLIVPPVGGESSWISQRVELLRYSSPFAESRAGKRMVVTPWGSSYSRCPMSGFSTK